MRVDLGRVERYHGCDVKWCKNTTHTNNCCAHQSCYLTIVQFKSVKIMNHVRNIFEENRKKSNAFVPHVLIRSCVEVLSSTRIRSLDTFLAPRATSGLLLGVISCLYAVILCANIHIGHSIHITRASYRYIGFTPTGGKVVIPEHRVIQFNTTQF